MIKHIKPERVIEAARALSVTNNALFIEFLILKFHGISVGTSALITNESTRPAIERLMAVRRGDESPIVEGLPYFNPFARSDGWRVEDYPRTGPQTNIGGPAWGKIVNASADLPRTATLKPDYIQLMTPGLLTRKIRGAERIPFGNIAVWAARLETFDDSADAVTLETWFQSTFNITTEERTAFFEGGVADDPFAAGPPDRDELAALILSSFPPGQETSKAAEDDGERAEAKEQAAQELPEDLLERIRGELVIPDVTIRQLITLIRMGKNVILTGPPGTGKTTLAERLAKVAVEEAAKALSDRKFNLPTCSGFLPTTATADWSTFDTIGGYVPSETGGNLEFREGLFLQAIREDKWLIIDELNRSDADKAFGQLFTVLSGQGVELPFRAIESGKNNLSIRRDKATNSSGLDGPSGCYIIGGDGDRSHDEYI